jgi:hypothetical protein
MLKLAMEIKLVDQKTVLIKGKKESVLINPSEEILSKQNSRIIVYSHLENKTVKPVSDKIAVAGPGEYEIGGVEINGFSDGSGGTFYSIKVDGFVIGLVDKLGEELSDKKIEKIDGIDVFIFDVSNESSVGSKSMVQLAKKWGANYLLPVGATGEEDYFVKFMDEADCEGKEAIDVLKLVDKENLPDGMEVVILK